MARPRKTKEGQIQSAKKAFQLEVKLQRVRLDMAQGELADAIGMNRSVLSRSLANPDKLSVERLRRIGQTLDLNPLTILALLGYESKVIQSMLKDNP